ncbi:DHH family phosphoesterase [Haladaptatus sp. CMSO5]|uniref:DHH family phosphoesterase n=1 Tax=Haladaptatus sp. CMSO5 TaxID=3120514 RepID=UPI002FCE073C
MDDYLIDDEHLSLSRKSVLPGTGFFTPDSFEDELEDQEVAEAVDGASTVVIADPDADGLACVALIRAAFGEAALVGASPYDLEDAMERVAAYAEPGASVFICDLCPDKFKYVDEELHLLVDHADVTWYDHHQWNDEVAEAVRETGVELVIGNSEEECTADVALRSIDFEFPDYLVDLAAVTRDHDLWLREDPRSDDLADLAYWSEPAEYAELIQEHGADLPEEAAEFLAEMRVEKEALIEQAISRANFHEIGEWTVGVTYGRCSQNEVAEALREQGSDAAVIVKPAGSASIRGTETFKRCHEVAEQVNGGGHPKAAGCKPDIYNDMLDYAHHWTTQGAVTKQAILSAFERLAVEESAEDDTDSDDE